MLPVKKFICLLTALALLVCTLAGCGTEEDARPLYADQGKAQRGELTGVTPASDAAAILDCLAQAGQIDDLGRETVTARDNQTPGKELSVPEPNRSVVVNDGAYIYMLDSYGLIVVSAASASLYLSTSALYTSSSPKAGSATFANVATSVPSAVEAVGLAVPWSKTSTVRMPEPSTVSSSLAGTG